MFLINFHHILKTIKSVINLLLMKLQLLLLVLNYNLIRLCIRMFIVDEIPIGEDICIMKCLINLEILWPKTIKPCELIVGK